MPDRSAPHPLPSGSRQPVTTAAELAELSTMEITDGYLDGRSGEPEPGDNRSRSYWHGWRNGALDRAGRSDAAQRELIADLRRTGRL